MTLRARHLRDRRRYHGRRIAEEWPHISFYERALAPSRHMIPAGAAHTRNMTVARGRRDIYLRLTYRRP